MTETQTAEAITHAPSVATTALATLKKKMDESADEITSPPAPKVDYMDMAKRYARGEIGVNYLR